MLCPRSTDGHGAACLAPPSPLMQLGPPRAQSVWMEGWRHRPSGSAPGGSLGGREPRLPGEKTPPVVSVKVFKFLILWVKKYILRPGHSRPERQAPGQGSTLVVSVQGRPQSQLQYFIVQPPGLRTERYSGQPGRRGTVGAEPVPWAWSRSRPPRGGPHSLQASAPCAGGLPFPPPPPRKPAPSAGGLRSTPPPPPHKPAPSAGGLRSTPLPPPHKPAPLLGVSVPLPRLHSTSLPPLLGVSPHPPTPRASAPCAGGLPSPRPLPRIGWTRKW